MKNIVICMILSILCFGIGAASFAVNDMPHFQSWYIQNRDQFRRDDKHYGPYNFRKDDGRRSDDRGREDRKERRDRDKDHSDRYGEWDKKHS